MSSNQTIDTKVSLGNGVLPFPVLAASGTFGYGEIYKHRVDYSKLGAIICKTLTLEEREGNPHPQIYKLKTGILNSVGLKNYGLEKFITIVIPEISKYVCPFIVSLSAEGPKQFAYMIERLSAVDAGAIWGWELNLSCPNVSQGTDFGKDPKMITKIVRALRPKTKLPILVKLPPNVTSLIPLAQAAEDAGADAISAINTLRAMYIDTASQKPVLYRKTGGLSGEGIFPIALAMVYELCKAIKIPIIGIGGISSSDQAIQFLLAGARAVQIGTALYEDENILNKTVDGIIHYCLKNNLSSTSQLKLKDT